MDKVGVVGAGMMGAEIALCFAMAGNEVTMKDATLALAQQGKDRLEGVLDTAIQKGRFQAEEKAPTLSRITCSDQYEDLKNVDLIVEAVFEDLEIKTGVFAQLDSVCKADCVFATNTSSSLHGDCLTKWVRHFRLGIAINRRFACSGVQCSGGGGRLPAPPSAALQALAGGSLSLRLGGRGRDSAGRFSSEFDNPGRAASANGEPCFRRLRW